MTSSSKGLRQHASDNAELPTPLYPNGYTWALAPPPGVPRLPAGYLQRHEVTLPPERFQHQRLFRGLTVLPFLGLAKHDQIHELGRFRHTMWRLVEL
jgi:hypothetical protein